MDLSLFLYSSNNLEFQLATHHYYRPKTEIFESIDSFIKPNLLFQMTISKNHPCRQTGLRNVLETLGNPVNPELYFVVPPDIFPSFTYQNYIGKDGKVLSESGIVGSFRKLSQFVLTFELVDGWIWYFQVSQLLSFNFLGINMNSLLVYIIIRDP
jgi:hypothetical protein